MSQDQVFLSYSRNDAETATLLKIQLEKHGIAVFKDDKDIRPGDRWLELLQDRLENCTGFVVLVGRDGVRRWIAGETEVALSRHFGPQDDRARLPIFPILIDEPAPEPLPSLLRLFQTTSWNGRDPLRAKTIESILERSVPRAKVPVRGCPFVGLISFKMKHAGLFFGRENETLDALACFDIRSTGRDVRWLEIIGGSGSGKSSLMKAGLLPLVDQGWLFPRTCIENWYRIGPMTPGQNPVRSLAEALSQLSRFTLHEPEEVGGILDQLADTHGLSDWLVGRTNPGKAMTFLLAIDQFEELLTFAEPKERRQFELLIATALEHPGHPLFLMTTMRSDFMNRLENDLPRLAQMANRIGKSWRLPPIGPEGLRDVIARPAELAGLDCREVLTAIVGEASAEPGALPLVENALLWLYEHRKGARLSGQKLNEAGGIAGILKQNADTLLKDLGDDSGLALELLFHLVRVDPDGTRHTRRPLRYSEAVAIAGGGKQGEALIARLSGQKPPNDSMPRGAVRLVTVSESADISGERVMWVDLIHETLVRSGGSSDRGESEPYWPTLWNYVETHKEWERWRAQLDSAVRAWLDHSRSSAYLWSHEHVRDLTRLRQKPGPRMRLTTDQAAFLGPVDIDEMFSALEQPTTTHQERVNIGERLTVFGDPRPGVGVNSRGTPDIEWCRVSGGATVIVVRGRLVPVRRILKKVLTTFRVARYPVTVTQFRAFLEAEDGWGNERWWGDGPDGDIYMEDSAPPFAAGRFGNRPSTYVSWFDATAYCRWLSVRLKLPVRLPDEWEWYRAASGGNADWLYPWGDDWRPKTEPFRANTFESGIQASTSVGMYPKGASPYGAVDMAGTVWEWCRNEYQHPDNTRASSRNFQPRALRGGFWGGDRHVAQSAGRMAYGPGFRSPTVGFRLVCPDSKDVQ